MLKHSPIKVLKILIFIAILSLVFFNGFVQDMPADTSFAGTINEVVSIEFIRDLTYMKEGRQVHEQEIFARIMEEIKRAEEFIIVDMFLFNDDYERTKDFPGLTAELTRALIDKKKQSPDVKVVFITDPINTFYGSYSSKYLEKLKDSGVQVIITDLNEVRDSNPLYAGFWRTFVQWAGTGGDGWLPNPFSPDSPEVTLRSYLKLLNFKANHRKVVITEKSAVVTSFNPHDASAYHSNIGFVVQGEIINDLIRTEKAVAEFSGHRLDGFAYQGKNEKGPGIRAAVLTEGKIRRELIKAIKGTAEGDEIRLAMFYLAERDVINGLIRAADRGVDVKIVLDPNKDAFGREKNGIPNRQVAYEMFDKSNGDIKIRWYDTHGEQFHAKMVVINTDGKTTVFAGSANLTRRNIDDFNLETDFMVEIPPDSPLRTRVNDYFNRIWNNQDGDYTIGFENYEESSFWKWAAYRIQEWSGFSTF